MQDRKPKGRAGGNLIWGGGGNFWGERPAVTGKKMTRGPSSKKSRKNGHEKERTRRVRRFEKPKKSWGRVGKGGRTGEKKGQRRENRGTRRDRTTNVGLVLPRKATRKKVRAVQDGGKD